MFGYLHGKALTFWMEYNSRSNNSTLTFTSCFICAPEKIQKAQVRGMARQQKKETERCEEQAPIPNCGQTHHLVLKSLFSTPCTKADYFTQRKLR